MQDLQPNKASPIFETTWARRSLIFNTFFSLVSPDLHLAQTTSNTGSLLSQRFGRQPSPGFSTEYSPSVSLYLHDLTRIPALV